MAALSARLKRRAPRGLQRTAGRGDSERPGCNGWASMSGTDRLDRDPMTEPLDRGPHLKFDGGMRPRVRGIVPLESRNPAIREECCEGLGPYIPDGRDRGRHDPVTNEAVHVRPRFRIPAQLPDCDGWNPELQHR